MRYGYCSFALLAFLTCLCTLSAGCLSSIFGPASPPATPVITPVVIATSPTPESPVASLPAADMALQPVDVPPDYSLRDRTVTAYAGVGKIYRDMGWRQGYRVSFCRLDKDKDYMTSVVQEISIYPLESVKDIFSLEKEALLPPENSTTGYLIPFPLEGDRSIAWRETRSSNAGTLVTYTVIFTKKNVYEKISMSGTSTDYEILKDITRKAGAKIR